MAGIPVNRFYPPNIKKSPAVVSLEKQFPVKCSFEHDGMDLDFTKGRTWSTSTPLVQKGDYSHMSKSPVATSALFDSGYVDSFGLSSNSLSISKSANEANETTPVTSSACFATPGYSNSSFSLAGRQLNFTPVSPDLATRDDRKNTQTVSWGTSCVKYGNFFYNIPEEELDSDISQQLNGDVSIWTPQHRLEFISDDEEDDGMHDSFSHHMISASFVRDGDVSFTSDHSEKSDSSAISIKNITDPHINLEERFQEVLQMYTPKAPDRLIGRKMGLVNVDILAEVYSRSLPCLSTILNFLSPTDLCRVCSVSRIWQELCTKDHRSNKRRLKYLKSRRFYIDKENFGKKKMARHARGLISGQEHLATLQNANNIDATPVNQRISTTASFQNAASSLKCDESLHKCPKCGSPSRVLPVQDRGQCCNRDCNFDYCIKCLNDFHKSQVCSTTSAKKSKSTLIGSKKSKKNLRRL